MGGDAWNMVEPRFHGRHALHGRARHKLGDSLLGPLMQQFDLPLLLRDQLVDAGGLAVEEGGDDLLSGDAGNRDVDRSNAIQRQTVAGNPLGSETEGFANRLCLQTPKEKWTNDFGRIWAQYCEMVSANNSFRTWINKCRNGDIIRRLAVLRDDNVTGAKPEFRDFLRLGRIFTELDISANPIVVIDIDIVAEADDFLALFHNLIDVAGPDRHQSTQGLHRPRSLWRMRHPATSFRRLAMSVSSVFNSASISASGRGAT